ncbi:iron transporter [Candidatus Liberibacter sp.]|uniref:iron transporter n=1 Tax=Candidatus Liberibacter sp. TaxID=34022 RepID=UPI0015F5DC1B|nr:iron transporter [Candidatus Liberibacter sp.]MBA5724356.1 iron transporter [Candidatus Liberibacter sp.]
MKNIYYNIILSFMLFSSEAFSQEYPLGKPIITEGMEIQGVYLQAISMDTEDENHSMSHLAVDKSDIHLEADIRAVQDNPNGFAEGDWIPYLTIGYSITKFGEDSRTQSGMFMPMVASDGPHYGENVKLDGGYGKYHVIYKIYPPSYNKQVAFARHIDKETGVSTWFKPFEVSWDFDYAGIGRKGSY